MGEKPKSARAPRKQPREKLLETLAKQHPNFTVEQIDVLEHKFRILAMEPADDDAHQVGRHANWDGRASGDNLALSAEDALLWFRAMGWCWSDDRFDEAFARHRMHSGPSTYTLKQLLPVANENFAERYHDSERIAKTLRVFANSDAQANITRSELQRQVEKGRAVTIGKQLKVLGSDCAITRDELTKQLDHAEACKARGRADTINYIITKAFPGKLVAFPLSRNELQKHVETLAKEQTAEVLNDLGFPTTKLTMEIAQDGLASKIEHMITAGSHEVGLGGGRRH